MMVSSKKWAFLQLLLILGGFSEATHMQRRNAEEEAETEMNVCSILDPKVIFCYCDTREFNQATEGNCWIFGDTSLEEHSEIWEDFASQNHIKHLTLHLRADGTVIKIPTIAFLHLQEIEDFEVQYATISKIHPFAFGNSSTVKELLLSRNGISELEPSAFANMQQLTKILLGENQLAEINRDVFVNLPNLKNLYIEQNNITQVADHAFHELTSLTELELFHNQIKAIVPATFIGLESLKSLDLSRNNIEVIGNKTFQYLKSLEALYLQTNAIKFIAPKGFFGLKKLRKLKIGDNKLMTLGSDIFKNNKELSYLDFSMNVLETLEKDAFQPIRKMLLKEGMVLVVKGNLVRCDTRLEWLFTLYNETQSSSVKSSLEEMYCYLETGDLPSRFEPEPTPDFEVTTLGIGPRVQLMKLLVAELPDPLLRTATPFTEEDCEEEEEMMKKKIKKPKMKKEHKMGKKKMSEKLASETIPEQKEAQNDMASKNGGTSSELRPAAPVHESRSFGDSTTSGGVTKTISQFSYILLMVVVILR